MATRRPREPQKKRSKSRLGGESRRAESPATDQPDPVTLSEPTFDASGRLRWSSSPH